MSIDISPVWKRIYDQCGLSISRFQSESESREYVACRFELNGAKIVCRNAKITPKKVGQFVTFWRRNINGIIEPLHESDPIDFYVVNVKTDHHLGQFVFPKSTLIKKGIISTGMKEGKRGFRVYPNWDEPQSNQAKKTQDWQSNYFYEVNEQTSLKAVIELYQFK